MKVRDLIRDTVWYPGSGYQGPSPLVSVLMPTFRRGVDRSFGKAARTILSQSLRDLELIIVDDASTDGTAAQIEFLMSEDNRVSCLRYPQNIGLPAVSEYEAYTYARGQYIAFGFDDFIFAPESIEALLTAAQNNPDTAVHGYGKMVFRDRMVVLGLEPTPHEYLRFGNFLLNGSFLVPRAILADVGLYDPHIIMSRLCDWDLWRRILRRYPIVRVPVFVGQEYGQARDDSLGNTYPLNEEVVYEYAGQMRDELLKPQAFLDFDVWTRPGQSSAILTSYLFEVRKFFSKKKWALRPYIKDDEDHRFMFFPDTTTIGVCGQINLSNEFSFSGLFGGQGFQLFFIDPDAQIIMPRCLGKH